MATTLTGDQIPWQYGAEDIARDLSQDMMPGPEQCECDCGCIAAATTSVLLVISRKKGAETLEIPTCDLCAEVLIESHRAVPMD